MKSATPTSPVPWGRCACVGWALAGAALGCGGAETAPEPPACEAATRFAATGFFRLDQSCGRDWLVAPDGARFFSFGVNHVSYAGDYSPASDTNPYAETVTQKYGSEAAWAEATAARLTSCGWNTAGAWSSYDALGAHLPYTLMLGLAQADWQSGVVPDYFTAEWAAGVAALCDAAIPARRDDPRLVGYFIDNELHWGADWRIGQALFDDYLALGPTAAGKQTLVDLLATRHGGDIAAFNGAWGTAFASFEALAAATSLPYQDLSAAALADRSAFLTALAERFFSVTVGAIRARDPAHLVLGTRFVATLTPLEVAAVAGAWLDVVSVNAYEFSIDPTFVFDPARFGYVETRTASWLEAHHAATGRPLLVSEFGFRAADSGLPNSWPPVYPTLAHQRERADRFAAYAERVLAAPYFVGYHWFEYTDQPATGRFDGEDNNWGVVDVADDTYEELCARSRTVHGTLGLEPLP